MAFQCLPFEGSSPIPSAALYVPVSCLDSLFPKYSFVYEFIIHLLFVFPQCYEDAKVKGHPASGSSGSFFLPQQRLLRVEIKYTIPSPQRAKSSILLVDRFYVFKEITLEHPQMGRLNWKLGQGNTTEPISPIRLSCTKKSYLNYLSLKFKDISQCQTHCKYYLGHVWPTETQNVSMTEALLDRSDPEFLCCAGVPTCLQCAAQAGPSLNLFLWSAPSSLPLKLIQCKPILIGTFPGPSSMLRCLLL